MSYFGKFYLTGPDAQAAADWVFSARMDGEPGKTIYTCMLNSDAGTLSQLVERFDIALPGDGKGARSSGTSRAA